MEENLFIGIDLGGTNIKGILVTENGQIQEEMNVETQDDPMDKEGKNWKEKVRETVNGLSEMSGHGVQTIGLSAPGLSNENNTSISYLPNRLLGMENFLWTPYLGIETWVLNDAHAHLIAESRFGAGRGYKNVIMLTLGTGVGGGILIDGKLYQGEMGRAGHFGHFSIYENGSRSIAGTPGSLENAFGECTLPERSNGKYTSTEDLVEAYKKGDEFATSVWLKSIGHLAGAIVSLINAFSPQLLILGGGISKAGTALLAPLNELLDIYEWRPGGHRTEIKIASMGKNAGAMGAALFALTRNIQN